MNFSEARAPSGIIFQILGVPLRNYGLQVNFKETEGPICKIPKITDFWIYSEIEKFVDSVHGSWIARRTRVHGGPERREHKGRGGAWPAHSAPGVGARRWGGRGRAGQGEARRRLTEAEPTAERRCEVRHFPTREAAIGQGTIDVRLGRPRGQGPVERRRVPGWGRKKEVGHGWAENRSWTQFK
jgi:hypothetical protein